MFFPDRRHVPHVGIGTAYQPNILDALPQQRGRVSLAQAQHPYNIALVQKIMHCLHTLRVLLALLITLGAAQVLYELEYVCSMPLTMLVTVLNFSGLMQSRTQHNLPSRLYLFP